MAKRDPDKTARNRIIANIKGELRELVDQVLLETGIRTEASLNAKIEQTGTGNDVFAFEALESEQVDLSWSSSGFNCLLRVVFQVRSWSI